MVRLAVALMWAGFATSAGAACSSYMRTPSKPSEPVCLQFVPPNIDEFWFNSCRFEVEQFQQQTVEFLDCLRRDQKDAIDAVNKAVERFNCYARRERVCF